MIDRGQILHFPSENDDVGYFYVEGKFEVLSYRSFRPDLNPSAVRRNVRSQQLEASLSSERDEIEEFIIASQEQEQNEIKKEVQNTFIAGNTLGIKFGDSGIKRMTKMIENEAKILKAALKSNSFAPLMRDE
ncbi:hypothetical protein RHMOL_Rhmol02G0050200 [Rhododendron molle]|uniref:Uncharacterized protein n=1 Tax=Rhododendron molle TaxID=49168 RepID=A0ACC0PP32_RHOML|nr:hypothetical protein RHMOL_Rhmol02G0050200 [Rhododendron molle]